jgi:hypothetical protein
MATKTLPRPTDRMISFMQRLASERLIPELGSTAEERVASLNLWLDMPAADKYTCMHRIDDMKRAPFAPKQNESASEDLSALSRGVYERNGEIFVVKPTKDKQRLYAMRVVEIRGQRLTEDDEKVNFELEYVRGGIYNLRPQDKMTKKRAEEFLTRYARCIVCNRSLKDATSVERGIGPVCITYFA